MSTVSVLLTCDADSGDSESIGLGPEFCTPALLYVCRLP